MKEQKPENTNIGKDLPEPLKEKKSSYLLASIVGIILGITLCISMKSLEYAIVFSLPAYFLYQYYRINKDFNDGVILESIVVCQEIKPVFTGKALSVTFSENQEDESVNYLKFTLSKKAYESSFEEGSAYCIYYTSDESGNFLIASMAV